MNAKTQKKPEGPAEPGQAAQEGPSSAADVRVAIFRLISRAGVESFAEGLAGAIEDIDVFAPRDGPASPSSTASRGSSG